MKQLLALVRFVPPCHGEISVKFRGIYIFIYEVATFSITVRYLFIYNKWFNVENYIFLATYVDYEADEDDMIEQALRKSCEEY